MLNVRLGAAWRGHGRRLGIVATVVMNGIVPWGTATAAEPQTLVLYGAQHEQMMQMLTQGFKQQTGIEVTLHKGEAPEIANQLAQEGSASPADLYITENSPELLLLEEKGLLAKVDPSTLAEIPSQYSSPRGVWLGILARENVLQFNKGMIKEEALPASLMDLAKPQWKGKLAFAPTDADFLPLISAVRLLEGDAKAVSWLKAIKDNGQVYDDDEGVVAAVDRGTAAVGIINSYYFERYRVETGADKVKSDIHHFGAQDPGALVNISGAAILQSSKKQEAAQKFLAYIVSKPVQAALAASDVDFEYPLAGGVPANPVLRPFATLQPPAIDLTKLGDDQGAADLLRQAGLL